MNTKKNSEDAIPRALREVWEWKETVSRETAGLTTVEALKRMHAEAEALCREYGLYRATSGEMSLRIAESLTEYGRKDDDEGSAKP